MTNEESNKFTLRLPGYHDVEAAHPGEFKTIPADGYVCVIRKVETGLTQLNRIKIMISLDIAEGEFAGFYKNSSYPPIYHQRVYDENNKVSKFFKGFLYDVSLSNSDFKVADDESIDIRTLISKKVGMIFREEEYFSGKDKTEIKTAIKPYCSASVKQIREKDFEIPPPKKAQDSDTTSKSKAAKNNTDEDEFIQDEIPDNRVPF